MKTIATMRQGYRLMGIAVSVLIGAGLFGSARADDTKTKQEIQAAYDKLSAAYRRKDTETILAMHTDDFTTISIKGVVTHRDKEALRKRLLKLWPFANSIDDHATVQNIVLHGKDVIATVHDDYTRTEIKGKHVGVVHEVETARAYWANTSSGWLLKQERTTSSTWTITVDDVVTKRVVNGEDVP